MSDLTLRNTALLLRWWWKGYDEPNSMWTMLISKIRWQGNYAVGPKLWSRHGSFFWYDLISIKHVFSWSITWEVGDGTSISFWYDEWGCITLAPIGTRCSNHAWSLYMELGSSLQCQIDLQRTGDWWPHQVGIRVNLEVLSTEFSEVLPLLVVERQIVDKGINAPSPISLH